MRQTSGTNTICQGLWQEDWEICSILIMTCPGFTDAQWKGLIERKKQIAKWKAEPLPLPIPLKEFKQTHTNLPVLDSYKGELSMEYWGK